MKSPFKFLDAYEQDDKDIFFGRGEEVEQLYRLLFEANLVLVYGQSGTGKTSLIQCGLANRFQPTDWFQLFVRRQDNINLALDREIRAHAETAIPPGASVVEAVRSLYLDHLRPVFLIFDQFEELFILGNLAEQDAFIAIVAELLASDVSCKIIISLREEYLAMLHRFEKTVPTLFNKRLRVERMSMANVRQVVVGTTAALDIRLEHGEETAQKIVDSLADPHAGVQLAYLQVYLDRLYRRATEAGVEGPIVFTDLAVEETGKLGDLMEDFLGEQTAAIQADLAARHKDIDKSIVQHVLEDFVTIEGTKQPMIRADLAARLPGLKPRLDEILVGLQQARILRCTDHVFELAHDSLAAPIAERRSAHRKALLLVQKLVRDRMAAFAETRTWLNRDELAVVGRNRARLELAKNEAAFVDRSASRARWKRIILVAGAVTIPLMVVGGYVLWTGAMFEADDNLVRAHKDTDELAYSTYVRLLEVPGTSEVRTNLLEHAAWLNRTRGSGSMVADAEDIFWDDLSRADLARENGEDAEARQTYDGLVREVRAVLADYPDDLLARVKLRALVWRMARMERDPAGRRRLNLELIDVLGRDTMTDVISFDDDVDQACHNLSEDGGTSPFCQ